MYVKNIRDYANRNIEANRVLIDSAEDLANINQVSRANKNIVEFQDQQQEIINKLNQVIVVLNRFEQGFDRFETRLDEISIVSARAVIANCVKPNFKIQWFKRHDEALPHVVETYGEFMSLTGNQIIDFLNYYNLRARRSVRENRRILGQHLGIPYFIS
ncbi:hypothetical protein BpHYR1_000452 [Brachionus plicatilis]|uniref:Uncharacterized protein n=1 Tax=Brachionus plicatilis TaxID=10195 RepID=A0A3M7RN77_BRAPC|nr:hypothetical protein BpHYR1_000452 [Brachionus plicatilis]